MALQPDNIDQVGGKGTMGRVWPLLKDISGVMGVKRKLGEADWETSETENSSQSVDRSAGTEGETSDTNDGEEERESDLPGLASSSSSSDTAGDSAGGSDDHTDASDLSFLRHGLNNIVVLDDSGVVDLQKGEVVVVDGVARVAVPMVVGDRYSDDMVIVPGPTPMNDEEQSLHELEEREFEMWVMEGGGFDVEEGAVGDDENEE